MLSYRGVLQTLTSTYKLAEQLQAKGYDASAVPGPSVVVDVDVDL